MATIMQTEPPKLFTRDIAAFSDAELDEYLEANRGFDNPELLESLKLLRFIHREIRVEDPEVLKADGALVRRLRARAGAIDFDDLTARLQNIPADRDVIWERWHTGRDENGKVDPDCRSGSTTEPLDEEEEYLRGLEAEREHYNTLVSEGGRPSHPLDLLGRDIFENPGEYREILSYWQHVAGASSGPYSWRVFGSQLLEWQRFRKYQRFAREEGYFPKYPLLVQKRLTKHGFERAFQLDGDLDRQDKLTTWIEFLNYEYQAYDSDMRFVERHQPEYDAAWKELVDAQVLRPFETEEIICDDPEYAYRRASEEEQAQETLQSAKLAMAVAQGGISPPSQQRLATAQAQLDSAKKSLDMVKQRHNLIHDFYKKTKLLFVNNKFKKQSYLGARHSAKHRSILLRWIIQQIPLIELELTQAKGAAEHRSDKEISRKRRKRNPADDLTNERVSKRRKEDGENNAMSSRTLRASATPTDSQDSSSTQRQPQRAGHDGQQLDRNCHNVTTDEGWAIQRPGQIGQTSNAAVQPDTSELDNTCSVVQAPAKPRKREAKVYKKERESRRIAGHPPEFGMLPKRGEAAPLYEPPMQRPGKTPKATRTAVQKARRAKQLRRSS